MKIIIIDVTYVVILYVKSEEEKDEGEIRRENKFLEIFFVVHVRVMSVIVSETYL